MQSRVVFSLFIAALFILAFGLPFGVAQDQAQQLREEPVRALIKAFADARNAHDGQAVAALYSEDGEWISAGFPTPAHGVSGRAELSTMWGLVTAKVDRTISSIDFPSPNIAVVRVATQFEAPIGRHSEVFILVNEGVKHPASPDVGTWKIRVHQTIG
jgi:uncharacterized protein (TIGR02246 family)